MVRNTAATLALQAMADRAGGFLRGLMANVHSSSVRRSAQVDFWASSGRLVGAHTSRAEQAGDLRTTVWTLFSKIDKIESKVCDDSDGGVFQLNNFKLDYHHVWYNGGLSSKPSCVLDNITQA